MQFLLPQTFKATQRYHFCCGGVEGSNASGRYSVLMPLFDIDGTGWQGQTVYNNGASAIFNCFVPQPYQGGV